MCTVCPCSLKQNTDRGHVVIKQQTMGMWFQTADRIRLLTCSGGVLTSGCFEHYIHGDTRLLVQPLCAINHQGTAADIGASRTCNTARNCLTGQRQHVRLNVVDGNSVFSQVAFVYIKNLHLHVGFHKPIVDGNRKIWLGSRGSCRKRRLSADDQSFQNCTQVCEHVWLNRKPDTCFPDDQRWDIQCGWLLKLHDRPNWMLHSRLHSGLFGKHPACMHTSSA